MRGLQCLTAMLGFVVPITSDHTRSTSPFAVLTT
jgi:hypothetical protein